MAALYEPNPPVCNKTINHDLIILKHIRHDYSNSRFLHRSGLLIRRVGVFGQGSLGPRAPSCNMFAILALL